MSHYPIPSELLGIGTNGSWRNEQDFASGKEDNWTSSSRPGCDRKVFAHCPGQIRNPASSLAEGLSAIGSYQQPSAAHEQLIMRSSPCHWWTTL